MYRILTFSTDMSKPLYYTWATVAQRDCSEDALEYIKGLSVPWRIQEWIDAGRLPGIPAEAGWWNDFRNWADGLDKPMLTKFAEHSEVPVPVWLQQATDHSWHNDAMPHAVIWVDEARFQGVQVWVNYPAVEEREVPPRFIVELIENEEHWHNSTGETLYQGEDDAAAQAAAEAGRLRLTINRATGGQQ